MNVIRRVDRLMPTSGGSTWIPGDQAKHLDRPYLFMSAHGSFCNKCQSLIILLYIKNNIDKLRGAFYMRKSNNEEQ